MTGSMCEQGLSMGPAMGAILLVTTGSTADLRTSSAEALWSARIPKLLPCSHAWLINRLQLSVLR